jgi:mycothiol synthase
MDDVKDVVELTNASLLAEQGTSGLTVEALAKEWGAQHFVPERDALVVFHPEGGLVGAAEFWNQEPYVRPFVWARTHPDYEGQGIGTTIMTWAEERARRDMQRAPDEARVSLRATHLSTVVAAAELLIDQGFECDRHFYRMQIDMDPASPPPAPVWPEGIRVRQYVPGQDEHAVHEAIADAFSDHWGFSGLSFQTFKDHFLGQPGHDPSLWFLAVTDGPEPEQIVGTTLCKMKAFEDPGVAWVDDVAVRRQWRRQGVALAGLLHAFNELHQRGRYSVALGVDAGSLTGATRLYEKAGMHVAMRYDAYGKVLRDGVELSTETLEA